MPRKERWKCYGKLMKLIRLRKRAGKKLKSYAGRDFAERGKVGKDGMRWGL